MIDYKAKYEALLKEVDEARKHRQEESKHLPKPKSRL